MCCRGMLGGRVCQSVSYKPMRNILVVMRELVAAHQTQHGW